MAAIEPLLARGLGHHTLLTELLEELQLHTVMVIEDAHWAEGATLDALRFLGRRVARSRSLLVVTYRDDELGAEHPLRAVLGDLATTTGSERLQVPPLSVEQDQDPTTIRLTPTRRASVSLAIIDATGRTVGRLTGRTPLLLSRRLGRGTYAFALKGTGRSKVTFKLTVGPRDGSSGQGVAGE